MTQLEKELVFAIKDAKTRLELINKYVLVPLNEMIERAERVDVTGYREHEGGSL